MNDTLESPQEQLGIQAETWTFTIPAYRREAFDHKIDLANRRLDRAHITARFTPVYTPFSATKIVGGYELENGIRVGGTEVTEPWFAVSLDTFTLAVGPFTFVASLVAEEAGYTVHTAPGQNLDGWTRPPVDDVHCDHCGVKRNRNRIYVIRNNDTGQLLQVGHSCIELYTGMSPKGLWALQFDGELAAFASEDTGGGFSSGHYGIPVDKVLAYAFTFSDQGRNYVSVKAAEFSPHGATGQVVRAWLIDPPRRPSGKWATSEAIAEWETERDLAIDGDKLLTADEGQALILDIKVVGETLQAGTDYADNMATILAGEHVSGRNVGILASLVSVYAREKELAVQRERAPKVASGFLAPEGTRIKGVDTNVTLRTVRYWEGDYGITTLLVGYTDDMHCVVWKASGRKDFEPGDVMVLSAFTVKKHEVYGEENPIDQTVITRAVIKD